MRNYAVCISAVVLVLVLTAAGTAQMYSEAPMLAERVAAGELPPVEERLPDNPLVVEVAEEIGKYGGTLRKPHSWVEGNSELNMIRTEFMLKSYPLPGFVEEDIQPNVLEDWMVSDDGTKYTLTLRRGMRWSDGEPVTTEDVRFHFEDYLHHEELTSVFPSWLRPGGQPAELTIVDDHTFILEFAVPYGLFPLRMQSIHYGHYPNLISPAHYMKQWHIDYTDLEDLQPYLQAEGLDADEWRELYFLKNTPGAGSIRGLNPDYPTLFPWVVQPVTTSGITVYERNPYYWKVDAAGNQLPYIDRIRMELVQDQEMITMKILSGEVDYEGGAGGLPITNLPLYRENEDRGNYVTRILPPTMIVNPVNYFANLSHSDPAWRAIIQDKRFRQALSLGINREEINQLVFFGMGVPRQSTDIDGSPFWRPAFSTSYASYDPDRANALLDDMGLEQRDSEGWRLRPDGQRVSLPVEFFEVNANLIPTTELVVEYWRDLGIEATMRVIDPALWFERQGANETVMSVWHEDLVRPGVPFFWYVPHDPGISYAPLWQRWYVTEGREGEEPPELIQRLFQLYETVVETPDEEQRIAAGAEILELQAEHLFSIGTVGEVPGVLIASRDLRNIPDWSICTQWSLFQAEQVFFDR